MKKYKFTFLCNLFVCICLFGCSSAEGVALVDLTIENNSSPVMHLLDDVPYSGRVFQYEEGTELLSVEFYLLDGVYNGAYATYYQDGLPKHTAFFDNGVLNGLEEHYYENGQLKESVNYAQGKFNGKRMVYWSNGILKEQNLFSNGILGGENLFYFSDGKLRKRLKFDANGKRDGLWEDFHSNGQLKLSVEYQNGILLSTSDTFDFQGNIVKKQ
jgi:antitoxin component YwqK of YwqJK toxin-antitoxin module